MQQMPLSASISAPASMQNSLLSLSLTTVAVRPAAEELLPEVYTARGRKAATYLGEGGGGGREGGGQGARREAVVGGRAGRWIPTRGSR